MSDGEFHDTLNFGNSSLAWDIISARVEALVRAWEKAEEAPALAEFLPPPPLRKVALIELVKVDLEYRWRGARFPKRLEEYLAEFPELATDGKIPNDLIYEEYQVRRQAGETVQLDEYAQRFGAPATLLNDIQRLREVVSSTLLCDGQPLDAVDVGQRLEDFELVRPLGRGAFARVFLARQHSMQRWVALKISADRGDEPQTMAQLDHPNIVRVYDMRVLRDRRLRLLYMQYVPGGTLQGVIEKVRETPSPLRTGSLLLQAVDQVLAERRESPPSDSRVRQRLATLSWSETVCWIGARLASALGYAHDQRVLHRDLKPANVLVGANAAPKLADFNTSFCTTVEGATAASFFGGSLAYMSPEQLEAFSPDHPRQASELDARADIFSLGVVLWELLTGYRPFNDPVVEGDWKTTLRELTAQRSAGPTAQAQSQFPSQAPAGMREALCKALAAHPDQRFRSAAQLVRELELCLKPQAQRLLRPTYGKWRATVCRHSVLFLLLAGLLPNVIASGFNIFYNYSEIVLRLGKSAEQVFYRQLYAVNPAAYLVGVGVLLTLAWPVLRGVASRARSRGVNVKHLPRLRARCLRLGDYVAWVSAAEWAISGVVFPWWLYHQTSGSTSMQFEHYVQFLASQLLCGLLAATLAFFSVNFLSVRYLYPTLVQADSDDLGAVANLRSLSRRTAWVFIVAVAVPFVAILATVFVHTGRWALGGLTIVGLVGFFVSHLISRAIQSDIGALASVAVLATGDTFLSNTDSVESFFTSSR